MDFEEINDPRLKASDFQLLQSNIPTQQFRQKLIQNCKADQDPRDCKKWLKSVLDNYRIVRNNGLNDGTDSALVYQMIDLAQKIVKYYSK